ncbi:hypothetical protein CPAR01_12369 [Colletotrichum paranaense]|uniref:Uncharacterized protein n=1 Tax=Colletotrichum paranaense TaxID=1914294 RepID=A0ABQ9S688_9PEZI|nr:uncharacterized protein CPAR01_12369 [Colletotrichum paranaense]KAK1527811.1 hypothetical protein CPAR01_12369 [Colletotrichum paranaense]
MKTIGRALRAPPKDEDGRTGFTKEPTVGPFHNPAVNHAIPLAKKADIVIQPGQKRHLKRIALNSTTASASAEPQAEMCLILAAAPNARRPMTSSQMQEMLGIYYLLRCAGIRKNVAEFLQRASLNWTLQLPTPRDLPALTRLNAFDALARNALVLGIPVELIESDDGDSLFIHQGPERPGSSEVLPPHLSPTALQRTVKHHPWLDLFPIPKMRDNILRGIQSGEIDEDELCNALVCDLLDLDSPSKSSLVIWGDAWDLNGWELGPEFFRRWGGLVQGCPEVLTATNYWRQKRGVGKIREINSGGSLALDITW